MNQLALQRRLSDVIDEYEAKAGSIAATVEAVRGSIKQAEMATSIGGAYGGGAWSNFSSIPSQDALAANLRRSAWRYVHAELNIDHFASAADRKRWELTIENPPEFSMENLREQFGDYLINPRENILRGLAECFSRLDDAYKSHSKVKIGVAGLPKRIVIHNVFNSYITGKLTASAYGFSYDQIKDVFSSLAAYREQERFTHEEIQAVLREAAAEGQATCGGITIKAFKNGNAHLIFDKHTLEDINRALAEFYGDALPEPEPDERQAPEGMLTRAPKQFYPTPKAVLEHMDLGHYIERASRILEPSCGDGRILDFIADRMNRDSQLFGIEIDAERAAACRAKGHAVLQTNFLDHPPEPSFDLIVMNPPFFGRTWKKHVKHAQRFLAKEGVLFAILPASAWYDGHCSDLRQGYDAWRDLPVASFRESGTNVQTGFLRLYSRTGD